MNNTEDMIEMKKEKAVQLFREDLEKKGFTTKTVRNHCMNVDFYIDYLDRYHEAEIEDGIQYEYLADFFGYFFIRKCMWSTPATLKSTAASIKKFYKCLYEQHMIDEKNFKDFLSIMKDFVPEWAEECDMYNHGGSYYF